MRKGGEGERQKLGNVSAQWTGKEWEEWGEELGGDICRTGMASTVGLA